MKGLSLQWKLVGAMACLVVGALLLQTVLGIRLQSDVIQQETSHRVASLEASEMKRNRALAGMTRLYIEEHGVSMSPDRLRKSMDIMIRSHDALDYVIVFDTNLTAVVHTLQPERQGKSLKGVGDFEKVSRMESSFRRFVETSESKVEYAEAIMLDNHRWGTVQVGFSLGNLDDQVLLARDQMTKSTRWVNYRLSLIAIFFALLSLAAVWLYSRSLVASLQRLIHLAHQISRGNFDVGKPLPNRANDEMGQLFDEFALMAHALKEQTSNSQQLAADFKGLIERSPEGVIVYSQGQIVYANQAMADALRVETPSWLIGKELLDWIFSPDQAKAAGVLFGSMPLDTKAEWRFVAADQGRVIIEVTSVEFMEFEGQAASMLMARNVTDRRNLEAELLVVSDAEQERFALELHDGLGQVLTGLAYRGKMLEFQLQEEGSSCIEQARGLVKLANQASSEARGVAQRLSPVEAGKEGFVTSLQGLAHRASDFFDVDCTFHSNVLVWHCSRMEAMNLYRIAQEAVTNAVKHGRAKTIKIQFNLHAGEVQLNIQDDGSGIQPNGEQVSTGRGIGNMTRRARVLGGWLDVLRNADGGATVSCRYLHREGKDEQSDESSVNREMRT